MTNWPNSKTCILVSFCVVCTQLHTLRVTVLDKEPLRRCTLFQYDHELHINTEYDANEVDAWSLLHPEEENSNFISKSWTWNSLLIKCSNVFLVITAYIQPLSNKLILEPCDTLAWTSVTEASSSFLVFLFVFFTRRDKYNCHKTELLSLK